MNRLPLTYDLITPLGHFWCSDNPQLILQPQVIEWLEENDILFYLGYDNMDLAEGCDHFIVFENHYDSVNFKMRWF
jgi:hypothetical protein